MTIRVTPNSFKRSLIYLLMLLMPFHVFIFTLIPVDSLALWRDFVLLLLVIVTLTSGVKKDDRATKLYVVRFCVCALFALFFHGSQTPSSVWINVFRVYMFPSLIFVILVHTRIDKAFMKKVCRCYVYTAVFISIFGIVQMFFFSREFLRLIDVPQSSVLLADGTQRNIGLFRSANVMAEYVLFAIIIAYYFEDAFRKRSRPVILLVLLISLVLTYSMSAFVAVIALAVFEIFRKHSKYISKKTLKKVLIAALLLVLVIAVIAIIEPEFVFSIAMQADEKIQDIVSVLEGTNKSSTSSAYIHLTDLMYGAFLVRNNPNGLGFAAESFMVADKISSPVSAAVESSFLTIFIDFGVFVGSIFLLLYFYLLLYRFPSKADRSVIAIGKGIILISLTMFFFLPLIQSYELNFFVFAFSGLMYRYCKYDDKFNHGLQHRE